MAGGGVGASRLIRVLSHLSRLFLAEDDALVVTFDVVDVFAGRSSRR